MTPKEGEGFLGSGSNPPADELAEEEHSLDELARAVADGTISRGRALKLVGAALLGFGVAGLFPGVAEARRRRRRRRHHRRHRRFSRTCGFNQSGCNFGNCVCPSNTSCRATSFNDPGFCSSSSGFCGFNQSGCNFGNCVCPGNTFCIANGPGDPGFCSSSGICGFGQPGCNFGSCVCPSNTLCRIRFPGDAGFCA